MKIVNVPIEPIPNRYSSDWAVWFDTALREQYPCITIEGSPIRSSIQDGAFLDVLTTQHYKSQQITKICEFVDSGIIPRNERVVFLFHDGWFPIEQVAYLRDMLECHDWRFIGILHAGTYDPWDQTAQHQMYTWGKDYENAILKIYDKIVVASYYHRNLLRSTRNVHSRDIAVIPWKVEVPNQPMIGRTIRGVIKKNQIVFPHRLDPEKQPAKFDKMSSILATSIAPDWTTVSTACECHTKEEYYTTLKESKIAVSFALQETFGIAMVEAVICGCIPLVPDRLAYQELYPEFFRYKDDDDLYRKLTMFTSSDYWTNYPDELVRLQAEFAEHSTYFFNSLFEVIERI